MCTGAILVAAVPTGGRAAVQSPCYRATNCSIPATTAHTTVSARFAQIDLGTRFLNFMTSQGGPVWQSAPNASGGGSDAASAGLRSIGHGPKPTASGRRSTPRPISPATCAAASVASQGSA